MKREVTAAERAEWRAGRMSLNDAIDLGNSAFEALEQIRQDMTPPEADSDVGELPAAEHDFAKAVFDAGKAMQQWCLKEAAIRNDAEAARRLLSSEAVGLGIFHPKPRGAS